MLAVLALVAACSLVSLVTWLLARRTPPAPVTADLCEVCGAPATHELADDPLFDGEGFTAMVATYCTAHAPDGSARVT